MGLAGVSTQNPGLYLQAAADYRSYANKQIIALKTANESKHNLLQYPHPDPLDPQCPPVFYGQRPWRVMVDGGGLADEVTEENARIALEVCLPPFSLCFSTFQTVLLQVLKFALLMTFKFCFVKRSLIRKGVFLDAM